MTDNNARKKYVLSRHLDALIDRLINQDFRRRLSKNDFNDGWLKKILDPKEHEEYYDLDKSITEQDLRNEVRSLYFECLLDFLGSQDIKLVAQKYGDGGCKCSFKGRLAVLDYQPSILHGRYLSFTWITFSIDSFSDKSFRYVIIEPWIEDKIESHCILCYSEA